MNLLEPFKLNEIDLNKIVYPKIKENKDTTTNNNKKIIYIKYNDNNTFKNLVFQTPNLLYINKSANIINELETALISKEQNIIQELSDFLINLENKIKYDANNNAMTWFYNNDNNIIKFQKIIRNSDKYSNGTIKIKLIDTLDFNTTILYNIYLRHLLPP